MHKTIKLNPNNDLFPNLMNFPSTAREKVLTGSQMKMYDFMYSYASKYESMNAISYFGKAIKYHEVFEQIERYARAFKAYGIEHGDYVSVMLPNMPELIYIVFALNRIGAITNLIDPISIAELH